jgi:hypothetical protein
MYAVTQDATYCHKIHSDFRCIKTNRTNKVTTRNKKAQHIKSDVIYVLKINCWMEMRFEGELSSNQNCQRQPTIQINITGTGLQHEIKRLNISNKM